MLFLSGGSLRFFVMSTDMLRRALQIVVYCPSDAMHCMGQNIKSLAACVCVSVCVSVCAHGFWGQISRKRLEIEVRFQWDTNRKWHMADRLVT